MSKKKRAFRFLMSFVLVVSTVLTGIIPSSAVGSTFKDVPPDAYYADAVGWAVDKEITNGTSETTFSPDAGCTRGQCVTFLYRYAGTPKVDAGKASKFKDVKSGEYYADAVAWAVENNITSGTSETTFSPGDKCTRAQIVTFLWRYKNEPKAEYAGSFMDVKSDAYYAVAVSWAVDQNITKGMSDTTFGPDQNCTRAQIVTFLYRMDQASNNSTDVPGGTITDSWDQIIASCNDGTYKTKYKIGDTKELNLGSEGIVEMQIAAFDADELADGTGKAAITWISKQVINSDHRMNTYLQIDSSDSSKCVLSTGSIGGWANSEMRAWLNSDVKPLIPSTVRNSIKSVKKHSTSYNISANWIQNEMTIDDVWIPSYREVGGTNSKYETQGSAYTELFKSDSDRVKPKKGAPRASWWWLRSACDYGCSAFVGVGSDGDVSDGLGGAANSEYAVVFGFCMGQAAAEPDVDVPGGTITVSWSTIITNVNNGTYKSKYQIGDTKAVDLGSEGIVEMQIAAFDADELADGNGKAAITWISKQLLNSKHRMNPDREADPSDSSKYRQGTGSVGGWEYSEMRAWLKSDVKPLIPENVRNAIKPVKKYSASFDTSLRWIQNEISIDDVWIPSLREVYGDGIFDGYETEGPTYTKLFTSQKDRIKSRGDNNIWWWLRTANDFYFGDDGTGFEDISPWGATDYNSGGSTGEDGVALGFCI